MRRLVSDNSHVNSIIKAITWRILASLITTSLVFIFTGQVALAVEVGAVDMVIKLVVYYLHERLWLRIRKGEK